MAKEYIEREAVEKFITKGLNNPDKSKAYGYDAVEILTEVHYMDAADVVSRGVFEQVKWERDIAMEQLKDHKIPFGCIAPDVVEVVRCKECRYSVEMESVFGISDYECQKHGISCLSATDFCSYGERKK